MKKLMVWGAALCVAMRFTGCKSSELKITTTMSLSAARMCPLSTA